MWGEERETLWSGEVEQGTSREGDLEGGGGGVGTKSMFLLINKINLISFISPVL